MFNVLPDIFKKEIKSEYYLRRLAVIFIFIIFIQITFLVFILPSWLTSFYREREVSAEMESQKSDIVSKNANNSLQTIKLTNQNLSITNDNFNYSNFLPLIKDIIFDKTSAISLSEFIYDNSAASQAPAILAAGHPMSVSGIAKTREDLVGFVKKLQDSGIFSNVVSPIANLAKDKDISFIINLNAK